MANPNVTSTTMPLHHRGLLDVYNLYTERQPNHWKNIIGREITTDELYEEIATLSGLSPATTIREAGGIPFDQITVPFTKKFYLDIYAIGVEFSKQVKHKDVYNKLKAPSKMMAKSHYIALEQGVADVINNATNSSYTGIDGKVLAATDHPTASSSWSNVSTAAALSIGSLETMITDMGNQLAYRDYPEVHPGPWNLIVPTELAITAKRLLTSMGQPGTANNDKNVARDQINYVSGNPFLTDTNGYCLLPANDEDNPIRMMNGMPMTPEEDFDIRTYTHLFATVVERTFWWKYPLGTQFNAGA